MSDLGRNPEDRFSYVAAQMICDKRKPVLAVSDKVPHKPGCTVTEDGYILYTLEISDLECI